jgi:hypothetical protein
LTPLPARTDPELRRDVELLLAQRTGSGFLHGPAILQSHTTICTVS